MSILPREFCVQHISRISYSVRQAQGLSDIVSKRTVMSGHDGMRESEARAHSGMCVREDTKSVCRLRNEQLADTRQFPGAAINCKGSIAS
jgi:hypothetical protein